MGSYFRSVATPVEKADCLASLRNAWVEHFGEPPKEDAVRLLTTQWGLESTWGKHGYCYNLGNVRASSTSDYMYISGNEIINGELVWFSGDKPSELAKFRAFRSLAEAAAYFVDFMANRSKVLAVLKGSCDPMAYCQALKDHFYYTDTLEHYSSVFLKLHADVKDLPVPTTKAPDYPLLSPDPAGDPSLAASKTPAPAAAPAPAPTPAPATSPSPATSSPAKAASPAPPATSSSPAPVITVAPASSGTSAPAPPAASSTGAPAGMVVVAELTVTARLVGSTDPLPRLRVRPSTAKPVAPGVSSVVVPGTP
ncbi:MAG: hypothetical protein R3B70_40125, partial [Polyangiaceae bacterium]